MTRTSSQAALPFSRSGSETAGAGAWRGERHREARPCPRHDGGHDLQLRGVGCGAAVARPCRGEEVGALLTGPPRSKPIIAPSECRAECARAAHVVQATASGRSLRALIGRPRTVMKMPACDEGRQQRDDETGMTPRTPLATFPGGDPTAPKPREQARDEPPRKPAPIVAATDPPTMPGTRPGRRRWRRR